MSKRKWIAHHLRVNYDCEVCKAHRAKAEVELLPAWIVSICIPCLKGIASRSKRALEELSDEQG